MPYRLLAVYVGFEYRRDALCGLALTESLVFVLLDLFHFRGIDALEIE